MLCLVSFSGMTEPTKEQTVEYISNILCTGDKTMGSIIHFSNGRTESNDFDIVHKGKCIGFVSHLRIQPWGDGTSWWYKYFDYDSSFSNNFPRNMDGFHANFRAYDFNQVKSFKLVNIQDYNVEKGEGRIPEVIPQVTKLTLKCKNSCKMDYYSHNPFDGNESKRNIALQKLKQIFDKNILNLSPVKFNIKHYSDTFEDAQSIQTYKKIEFLLPQLQRSEYKKLENGLNQLIKLNGGITDDMFGNVDSSSQKAESTTKLTNNAIKNYYDYWVNTTEPSVATHPYFKQTQQQLKKLSFQEVSDRAERLCRRLDNMVFNQRNSSGEREWKLSSGGQASISKHKAFNGMIENMFFGSYNNNNDSAKGEDTHYSGMMIMHWSPKYQMFKVFMGGFFGPWILENGNYVDGDDAYYPGVTNQTTWEGTLEMHRTSRRCSLMDSNYSTKYVS